MRAYKLVVHLQMQNRNATDKLQGFASWLSVANAELSGQLKQQC